MLGVSIVTSSEASAAPGHCLLLIPSPSDELVYRSFRSVGQQWGSYVTDERLWIEGGVPLTPHLTTHATSPLVSSLAGTQLDVISRIELSFDGLTIAYVRSGGHGPTMFRESFFDEIRIEQEGKSSLSVDALASLCRELCSSLDVLRGTGSPEFRTLFEYLNIAFGPDVHQSNKAC